MIGRKLRRDRSVGHLSPRRPALTLVEVAMVMAFGPLLLAATGASLHKARRDCQTQLCAKRLAVLAQAGAVYSESENGWFLGSPATTGQQLWPGGASSLPNDSVNTPGDVVQIWDWAAPIARQILTEPLNSNRATRWREQLVTGPFECPSNVFSSVPFPVATPDWTIQRMVSYDSMRATMTRGGTAPGGSPLPVSLTYHSTHVGGATQTPFTYEPRVELVGDPAGKAFLADGARFTDASTGGITYPIDWQALAGGAFSDGGPSIPDQFLRSYFRSANRPDLAGRAYRHPCGQFLGLNVAYFDGHVEWMSEALSRNPDPWWPSDTVLRPSEMNPETLALVINGLTHERPSWWPAGQGVPLHYRVR